MKNAQKIDLGLTGYDELFMNEAERKENKLPRIYDIPISEIDDFPDHPFKVKIDEDMDQLVQSIKERGIITPVTLRPKEDGRYEIVSGHRRKKACELAGFETIKAEVREMTRDGTSVSGLAVDEFAVTNSKGVATFKDVLIGSGYTLEEVDTAIRYVVPANQSAAVEWNKETNKSFSNILKKFNVTVTKSDKEAGTAQGDASLAGATYGIYKGDQLVDSPAHPPQGTHR